MKIIIIQIYFLRVFACCFYSTSITAANHCFTQIPTVPTKYRSSEYFNEGNRFATTYSINLTQMGQNFENNCYHGGKSPKSLMLSIFTHISYRHRPERSKYQSLLIPSSILWQVTSIQSCKSHF